jgi:hypothetical protein
VNPEHGMSSIPIGWSLIAAGLGSGTLLGLRFHDEKFLGGYASWTRRLLRLGHVACVALGMANLLLAATVPSAPPSAALGLALGSVAMPLACLVVAFRPRWRPLFAAPVALLLVAVVEILVAVAAVRPGATS